MSHVHKAPQKMSRSKPFYGLTLVELLVVVGVISVITAIVLPSVKTILTDRKSSQSAIIVRNFFEAARARAIGKNRTVAVVLERVSSRVNPTSGPPFASETASSTVPSPDSNFIPYNACIRMSLAEEPLPFTELLLASSVTLTPRSTGVLASPNFPSDDYVGQDSVVNAASGFEFRAFNVQGPEAALRVLASQLITGAEISFGNSKRRFTIVSPRRPQVHQDFITRHLTNTVPQGIWFSVVNEFAEETSGERAATPYFPFSTSTNSFKIYGRPKPIYSEMVQLPRGMCIDLSLSGFGGDTIRNDDTSAKNTRPLFDPPPPPTPPKTANPLSDYRVRFASDWIGNGTVQPPPELRPVYIAFTPDGNLSHVWGNERSGANLTRIDATQDIFLHIGKIDQIVMPVDPAVGGRNKLAYLNAAASGVKQNLSDLNSYVIRLSPKSGSIIASPQLNFESAAIAEAQMRGPPVTAQSILDASSLGDLIELSRRGTYSNNVTSQ